MKKQLNWRYSSFLQPTEVFDDIVTLSFEIQSFKRPTGTKMFPAKTCKDLHMCHPKLPSGKTCCLLVNLVNASQRCLYSMTYFVCFFST